MQVLFNLLSEPERREKLEDVNTLGDVVMRNTTSDNIQPIHVCNISDIQTISGAIRRCPRCTTLSNDTQTIFNDARRTFHKLVKTVMKKFLK